MSEANKKSPTRLTGRAGNPFAWLNIQFSCFEILVYAEYIDAINYILPGLCPDPYFILCLPARLNSRSGGNTKNEARKFKTKQLPALSAARQEFQIKGRKLLY
jgi:hypothetical protein